MSSICALVAEALALAMMFSGAGISPTTREAETKGRRASSRPDLANTAYAWPFPNCLDLNLGFRLIDVPGNISEPKMHGIAMGLVCQRRCGWPVGACRHCLTVTFQRWGVCHDNYLPTAVHRWLQCLTACKNRHEIYDLRET
jgi:hypothetical protein